MSIRHVDFGEFLLVMAERCEQETARRAQVVDCLQQVTEAFGGKLDPAVEFEAFASVRLCRAIQAALERE